MKNLVCIPIFIILLVIGLTSCDEKEFIYNEKTCLKGTIIGKFSSEGGGVAVSLVQSAFNSEDSRQIFNDPEFYSNVVEVFNLSEEDNVIGKVIYFKARLATENDISGFPPMSSDGVPAKTSLVVVEMTNDKCEIINVK
ncbi:MAG: hypothetical protein O9340_05240 [Cyclobacteriaceae bacterium]|jgi:hypothetical protein|nr:hypothetical protein [Cyclobacteriaceae bacterium]